MSLNSIVQIVDPVVRLTSNRDIPFPDTLSVVELEVERVFGGGGSMAEVDIVLDDFMTEDQRQAIREAVRPEDEPRTPDYESVFLPDPNARTSTPTDREVRFLPEPARRELDIRLEIDVLVTGPGGAGGRIERRLFTGTLTKVTESHDRIITLHALDARHQLNRNSVFIDVERNTVPELVRNVLSGDVPGQGGDVRRGGLGFVEGEDFFIELAGNTPTIVTNQTWGVTSHTTVFEFLQNLANRQGATVHIDRFNRIWFLVGYPETANDWQPEGGQQMPPIVEWENAEEEDLTETIAETSYDETGLGTYAVTSRETLQAVADSHIVNKSVTENNIVSRTALENVQQVEMLSDELMRDSGTVKFVGDPRILPYDTFTLDNSVVDGFSPIRDGEYMTKTVRHIIDDQEGFVTEVELGDDPEELFEQFTAAYGEEGSPITEEDDDDGSDPIYRRWASSIGDATGEISDRLGGSGSLGSIGGSIDDHMDDDEEEEHEATVEVVEMEEIEEEDDEEEDDEEEDDDDDFNWGDV